MFKPRPTPYPLPSGAERHTLSFAPDPLHADAYVLMPVNEEDFDDPLFFSVALEAHRRLCASFQVVNALVCDWQGPAWKRWAQFYTPSGGTLARRFFRYREDLPGSPRSYQQPAVWDRRQGRFQDKLWTLTQGADLALLEAVYCGRERFDYGDGCALTLSCYRTLPFPTDTPEAVALGVARHPPALALFLNPELLRLFFTIGPEGTGRDQLVQTLADICGGLGLSLHV